MLCVTLSGRGLYDLRNEACLCRKGLHVHDVASPRLVDLGNLGFRTRLPIWLIARSLCHRSNA